jgi:hypothetical protein
MAVVPVARRRAPAVTDYRYYLLNNQNKIQGVETVECDNDTDALLKGSALLETRNGYAAIEIWSGQRIIGRVPHKPEPEPAPPVPSVA